MSDLKSLFIARALNDYMVETIAAIKIAAQRAKVGVTDEAVKSLAYKVLQETGGGFADLSFQQALRYVDMGVGRGHPLGGLTKVSVALQSRNKVGIAQVRDNIRKPKKIYARIVYGKLTGLQNALLYGFTEETIAQLKAEMQTQQF